MKRFWLLSSALLLLILSSGPLLAQPDDNDCSDFLLSLPSTRSGESVKFTDYLQNFPALSRFQHLITQLKPLRYRNLRQDPDDPMPWPLFEGALRKGAFSRGTFTFYHDHAFGHLYLVLAGSKKWAVLEQLVGPALTQRLKGDQEGSVPVTTGLHLVTVPPDVFRATPRRRPRRWGLGRNPAAKDRELILIEAQVSSVLPPFQPSPSNLDSRRGDRLNSPRRLSQNHAPVRSSPHSASAQRSLEEFFRIFEKLLRL